MYENGARAPPAALDRLCRALLPTVAGPLSAELASSGGGGGSSTGGAPGESGAGAGGGGARERQREAAAEEERFLAALEWRRAAVSCLGNVCVKGGDRLVPHYGPIFEVARARVRVACPVCRSGGAGVSKARRISRLTEELAGASERDTLARSRPLLRTRAGVAGQL